MKMISPTVVLRRLACTVTLSLLGSHFAIATEASLPIETNAGGAYVLSSQDAKLSGKFLNRSEQSGAIERWSDKQDQRNGK